MRKGETQKGGEKDGGVKVREKPGKERKIKERERERERNR